MWLLVLAGRAQGTEPERYRFVLQDGSALTGTLVTLTADSVAFRLADGQLVAMARSQVVRFDRTDAATASRGQVYAFEERGLFHRLLFGFNLTRNSLGEVDLGMTLGYTFGYQFNRWIGAGLGAGLDSYSFREPYGLITPVFVHLRAFIGRKRLAPVVSLDAGYGFALLERELRIVEATGGWLLHPAVGLRFGAHPKVNVALDVGYRFQRASYTEQITFGLNDFVRRDLLFQRLTFRFNLLF
jgi:hypothetical protein